MHCKWCFAVCWEPALKRFILKNVHHVTFIMWCESKSSCVRGIFHKPFPHMPSEPTRGECWLHSGGSYVRTYPHGQVPLTLPWLLPTRSWRMQGQGWAGAHTVSWEPRGHKLHPGRHPETLTKVLLNQSHPYFKNWGNHKHFVFKILEGTWMEGKRISEKLSDLRSFNRQAAEPGDGGLSWHWNARRCPGVGQPPVSPDSCPLPPTPSSLPPPPPSPPPSLGPQAAWSKPSHVEGTEL